MTLNRLILRGTLLFLAGCGGTTTTPDATPDVAIDEPAADVPADRTAPDAAPDAASDAAPDAARDAAPDTAAPDAALDAVTMDATMDVPPPDATPPDATTLDTTPPDATTPDATPDATTPDARVDAPSVDGTGSDVALDSAPVDPGAARLIFPLSNAVVTSHRPRLRWRLRVGDGAHVQICRNAGCTDVVAAFDAAGSDAQPAAPLTPGVYFWRIFERTGAVRAATPTVSWHFRVDPRDTLVDSASLWASDYNNDGYQDITFNIGTVEAQRALIFLGGPGGPSATPDQRLAVWLWPLSDLNGDGLQDARVDATVRLGTATGVSSAVFATAPTMGGTTQYVGLDDVNADGYADLLVSGGFLEHDLAQFAVYAGGAAGLSATPLVTVSEDFFRFRSGTSEGYLGDVNGDRSGDVGVSVFAIGGVSRSTAFLSLTPTWREFGRGQCNTEQGSSTYGAGDVNGDGYADLVASCGGAGDDTYPPRHTVAPGGVTDGPAASASFGASVLSRLGDVNGDGCGDLLVQEARIIGGGSTPLPRGTIQHGVCGATIATTVQRAVDLAGVEYLAVGDVNRDGYDDVVIAAADRTSARFFPGSATGLAAAPTVTFSLAP